MVVLEAETIALAAPAVLVAIVAVQIAIQEQALATQAMPTYSCLSIQARAVVRPRRLAPF